MTVTDLRFSQPLNVMYGSTLSPFPTTAVLRLSQPRNTSLANNVTLSGNSTASIGVPENAYRRMSVTVGGMTMALSEAHPANADSPMERSPSFNATDRKSTQPLKAESPITRTEAGRLTVVRLLQPEKQPLPIC